jgi:CRP-like cAMP-binding protein
VDIPLLDKVPEQARRDVLEVARRRRFAKHEVVFHEGDEGDTLYLLLKGHVAVRTTTPAGDVAMVRVISAGQIFGELALLGPAPRSATVAALDRCEALALHRQVIEPLREAHRSIDGLLLEALAAEIRRLASQLRDSMYEPAERRLYRRLTELTEMFTGEPPLRIPLTQEDLAQLAGTTRPTINKLLRSIEDAGIIGVGRGWLEVLDPGALRERAR